MLTKLVMASLLDQWRFRMIGPSTASRTARATSTAFGVSECTQMESARTAMSMPLMLSPFLSAIARRQRDATRAGSTA